MMIQFRQNFVVADHHPVCATKDAAQLFLGRAATPPRRGGESAPLHRLSNSPCRPWLSSYAAPRLETLDAFSLMPAPNEVPRFRHLDSCKKHQ